MKGVDRWMLARGTADVGEFVGELLAREHIKHHDLYGTPRHPSGEEVHDAMHHRRCFAGSSDGQHTGMRTARMVDDCLLFGGECVHCGPFAQMFVLSIPQADLCSCMQK